MFQPRFGHGMPDMPLLTELAPACDHSETVSNHSVNYNTFILNNLRK
jgi:hypothetical protein